MRRALFILVFAVACTKRADAPSTTPSASATGSSPPPVSDGGSLGGVLRDCPWAHPTHASVHDVDFCSCSHVFVGPLSGCRAEHRIYTAQSHAHYTTELELLTAFADVDGDGNDEAILVLRELDTAPTDMNAREHASLLVVTVRGGTLTVVASGGTGVVRTVAAKGRGFTLHEKGTKGECDVDYAVHGAAIEPTSSPCP